MKRNIILFVAATITLLLAASCNRKVEYEFEKYATLYHFSFSVPENVGELRIPVLVNNTKGADVQISVKLTEGTALENADYELKSPANGILSFNGDTDSLDIVITINAFEGEFTGGKDFSVELASLTEGVILGSLSRASVVINDLDHPMAPFVGNWKGTSKEEFSSSTINLTYDIIVDPNKPDEFDRLIITTVDPYVLGIPVELVGIGSLNADGTGRIVIPNEQSLGMDLNAGPGVYMGLDAATYAGASVYSDIYMNLNADGTMTLVNGYGVFDNQYIYGFYQGGCTLTK